jgi:hypothetical protein
LLLVVVLVLVVVVVVVILYMRSALSQLYGKVGEVDLAIKTGRKALQVRAPALFQREILIVLQAFLPPLV